MSSGVGLTGYDLVVLVLFALLVIRGFWLGFLKQVTGLLALYLGYVVAGQYHDNISPFLREISHNPKVVFFTSYVILFVATYVAVMLAGKALTHVMQLTVSSWFDKMLGGVLGGAKALLLIIIVHIVLTMALSPENKMLTACRTCNALNKTSIFARDLIKDEDVKKALTQQKAAISAQDVKEFFDTPPKEKPPAATTAPEKAAKEKAPQAKPPLSPVQ